MIPKTYHNGDLEDRAYVEDLWAWLKEQPQDAWLLFAPHANWDVSESIFERMISDPRCDLAVVAIIFWNLDPSYHVKGEHPPLANSMLAKIISNVETGYYTGSDLYVSRHEFIHDAHAFIRRLHECKDEQNFNLPRSLCGPFGTRYAAIPDFYGLEVEEELQEIFDNIDGSLPRSMLVHIEKQRAAGEYNFEKYLPLPSMSGINLESACKNDDLEYMEMFFKSRAEYSAACDMFKEEFFPRMK